MTKTLSHAVSARKPSRRKRLPWRLQVGHFRAVPVFGCWSNFEGYRIVSVDAHGREMGSGGIGYDVDKDDLDRAVEELREDPLVLGQPGGTGRCGRTYYGLDLPIDDFDSESLGADFVRLWDKVGEGTLFVHVGTGNRLETDDHPLALRHLAALIGDLRARFDAGDRAPHKKRTGWPEEMRHYRRDLRRNSGAHTCWTDRANLARQGALVLVRCISLYIATEPMPFPGPTYAPKDYALPLSESELAREGFL